MQYFFYILTNIILPIFILTGIGFVIQKVFKLDLFSINKLNIYVFVPAILFVKLYETAITWEMVSTIVLYFFLTGIFMLAAAYILSRVFRFSKGKRAVFSNTMLFFNSGNYGLPLIALAFPGNTIAMTGQIILMLVQNITASTFGVFQVSRGKSSTRQSIFNVLKLPSIYVFTLVVVIRLTGLTIPAPLMIPLRNISDGFIAIALVSLGIQLAEVDFKLSLAPVIGAAMTKLLLAPFIGLVIVRLLGIEGILAKSLVLALAAPSAVTNAIIAKEFRNEPEFASEIVFFTTVLSAITVTAIIYALEYL